MQEIFKPIEELHESMKGKNQVLTEKDVREAFGKVKASFEELYKTDEAKKKNLVDRVENLMNDWIQDLQDLKQANGQKKEEIITANGTQLENLKSTLNTWAERERALQFVAAFQKGAEMAKPGDSGIPDYENEILTYGVPVWTKDEGGATQSLVEGYMAAQALAEQQGGPKVEVAFAKFKEAYEKNDKTHSTAEYLAAGIPTFGIGALALAAVDRDKYLHLTDVEKIIDAEKYAPKLAQYEKLSNQGKGFLMAQMGIAEKTLGTANKDYEAYLLGELAAINAKTPFDKSWEKEKESFMDIKTPQDWKEKLDDAQKSFVEFVAGYNVLIKFLPEAAQPNIAALAAKNFEDLTKAERESLPQIIQDGKDKLFLYVQNKQLAILQKIRTLGEEYDNAKTSLHVPRETLQAWAEKYNALGGDLRSFQLDKTLPFDQYVVNFGNFVGFEDRYSQLRQGFEDYKKQPPSADGKAAPEALVPGALSALAEGADGAALQAKLNELFQKPGVREAVEKALAPLKEIVKKPDWEMKDIYEALIKELPKDKGFKLELDADGEHLLVHTGEIKTPVLLPEVDKDKVAEALNKDDVDGLLTMFIEGFKEANKKAAPDGNLDGLSSTPSDSSSSSAASTEGGETFEDSLDDPYKDHWEKGRHSPDLNMFAPYKGLLRVNTFSEEGGHLRDEKDGSILQTLEDGSEVKLLKPNEKVYIVDGKRFVKVRYEDPQKGEMIGWMMQDDLQKTSPMDLDLSEEDSNKPAEGQENNDLLFLGNVNSEYRDGLERIMRDKENKGGVDLFLPFNRVQMPCHLQKDSDGDWRISWATKDGKRANMAFPNLMAAMKDINNGLVTRRMTWDMIQTQGAYDRWEEEIGAVDDLERTDVADTDKLEVTFNLDDWENNVDVRMWALPHGEIGYRIEGESVSVKKGIDFAEGKTASFDDFMHLLAHMRPWVYDSDDGDKVDAPRRAKEKLYRDLTDVEKFRKMEEQTGRAMVFNLLKRPERMQVIYDWGDGGRNKATVNLWAKDDGLYYMVNFGGRDLMDSPVRVDNLDAALKDIAAAKERTV